ncbi:aminotransferase class I/II-fold pyridoxal phosphate-dependent enzyme [Streptomyces sp. So13.3]|uniref:aminotransferase class I/II-fold pyridoxal phosphate-dependent enzyme n=1 Tax=Streptomyces sp. So13.3 TaxID=2136173 RepID=UPI00110621CC|nr:aminotransferase class I/II-fold pyridoxal phosphate-dependent enzyme [Streptomyces sp. So13.3]QNA71959.1 aminotransferase class I/II-fold pyridoxal phosphate-dependent enzyme [Streptomyces sp. So13.3]
MTDTLAAGQDTARIHEQVVDIVASRTLYDQSYLLPESHFEGELGIDSVILESILLTVREHFGLPSALPGGISTIKELVHEVEQSLTPRTQDRLKAAPLPPRPDGSVPQDLLKTLVDVTMRHTHYQRNQLDLDADFESELGIDSVVLTSIVAEVAQLCGLAGSAPVTVTAATLRALGVELAGGRAGSGPPAPLTPAATAPAPSPALPAPTTTPVREHAPQTPAAKDGPWDDRSMKDFTEQRDPDLFAKARSFGSYFRKRNDDQLYWYGMPLQSRCENRAVIRDEITGRTREFLMFASNNYLGLANHPKVVEAVCDATRVYGATNTGCRLIGGTNVLHKELEQRLAAFKQRPACIVYPGGYSANIGAISALVKRDDTVIVDKLNHMSIVDGCRLSGGNRRIYRHNDMADLEKVLQRSADQAMGKLIVTDGVFSMHGDVCELPEIVRLAQQYGARVMVDDAHATGVLGMRGSGTAEHFGLKGEVDLELGTMSKTLAGMGGFVVGEEEVINYLRFYSNSYVFAATIPAGVAAGLIASIDVMESEPERVATLWSNIRLLRGRLADAGFDLENTQSAILPIVIGDERRAMEMGRAVRARGLFCQTVVFPGVPLGDARLRISVTSEHTREDLELAAEMFTEAGQETGVLSPATADARSARDRNVSE